VSLPFSVFTESERDHIISKLVRVWRTTRGCYLQDSNQPLGPSKCLEVSRIQLRRLLCIFQPFLVLCEESNTCCRSPSDVIPFAFILVTPSPPNRLRASSTGSYLKHFRFAPQADIAAGPCIAVHYSISSSPQCLQTISHI
jgi:hypothetical protein